MFPKVPGKIELRECLVKTEFVGYQHLNFKARMIEILVDNQSVDSLNAGQEGGLILDVTPFYGEMGGQVGDTGVIQNGAGRFQGDQYRPFGRLHRAPGQPGKRPAQREHGVGGRGRQAEASDIAANHSATHLLQYASAQVLGTHVHQRGSQVGPDEFRFDFSHLTP